MQNNVDVNHFASVELAVVIITVEAELFHIDVGLVGCDDDDFLFKSDTVLFGCGEPEVCADWQIGQGYGLRLSSALDYAEDFFVQ